MKTIQVLGVGCPKCKQMAANAEQAIARSGADGEVVKITDVNEITKFGVIMTPALAIDGLVRVVGRVASVDEILDLLG